MTENFTDSETDQVRNLVARIYAKRIDLDAFLDRSRPRNARLGVVSVVASSLAAVFTAGPAIGGDDFAGQAKDLLGADSASPIWRLLCAVAVGVSVIAAICTNLMRSQGAAAKISAAETTNAELANLQTVLEFGQLHVEPALKMYEQSLVKVSFVDEQLAPPKRSRAASR